MEDFMQDKFDLQNVIPSQKDVLLRTLEAKLNQEIVITKIKDEHKKFLSYDYFDADEFLVQINIFKAQRRIEDEYSEELYNYFLILAELKNQKEQQNNVAWINKKSNCIRPDIFNASLTTAVVFILDEKLQELKSEDNPLFNLQYVNYTQRINQNMTCIENVENAKNCCLQKKNAKPDKVWEQATKNNTSVVEAEQTLGIMHR